MAYLDIVEAVVALLLKLDVELEFQLGLLDRKIQFKFELLRIFFDNARHGLFRLE
jgi:hypothetical protein